MPFITDKLFTNVDSTNITTTGDVEKATSYGVFNDLTKIDLLTSADLPESWWPDYQANGTTDYTLDEYLSKIWSDASSRVDQVDKKKDQYDVSFYTHYLTTSIVGWEKKSNLEYLEAVDKLIKDGGSQLTSKISDHKQNIDNIQSAQDLLRRADIDTEAEADQLITNIIKAYDENNLTLGDGKSHKFEVNALVSSDNAAKKVGEWEETPQFFWEDDKRYQGWNYTAVTADVKVSLDYDEILRAAFSFSNGSNGVNVPSKAELGDSIYEYLFKTYNGDIGSGKIREDFTPGTLYRNLIPEAFDNSIALAAEADAKNMTGLDLVQLEYNYNVAHPDNQLNLSQDLWYGGVAPFKG